MFFIYLAYSLDIVSCYRGIIPFYRCNNAYDIYKHHIAGMIMFSLMSPVLFLEYSQKIQYITNKILSVGFLSSLNEAIMIYGTFNKLSRLQSNLELLFKVYIFSINTDWNIYNTFTLIKLLNYKKMKHLPIYGVCFTSLIFYACLYPGLLQKSIHKLKRGLFIK